MPQFYRYQCGDAFSITIDRHTTNTRAVQNHHALEQGPMLLLTVRRTEYRFVLFDRRSSQSKNVFINAQM